MSAVTKTRLRRFFQVFSAARVRLPAARGNLYEFFVFLSVCDGARRAGLAVSLSAPGGTYVVRASPGALGGGFGYASITSQSRTHYELHNGIEIDGQSRMHHEADLLMLGPQGTAPSGPPRTALGGRQLLWTAECKLYGSSSRLKGEARKAVGAALDWSERSHPSNTNGRMQGCLHCGMGFKASFVTNVRQGLRLDIEDFLGAYEITPCFGTLPGQSSLGTFRAHVASLVSTLP
jgi:hypothetical protein